MKNKLLAVDIGNTNITLGLFKGNKLLHIYRLPTEAKINFLKYKQLKNLKGIIICSVVPEALNNFKSSLKQISNRKPLIVGENISSGIKNRYAHPKEVGQDRLVNARAAYEIYKKGCIIIDSGTAITIDVVNSKKEYLGGAIAPGFKISLEALATRTALLPKVKLAKPKQLIGKTTKESILSGVIYGFTSLGEGMVKKFKKKLGGNFLVVLTGGHSQLIAPYCKNIDIVNPNLTLEGLKIIYDYSD